MTSPAMSQKTKEDQSRIAKRKQHTSMTLKPEPAFKQPKPNMAVGDDTFKGRETLKGILQIATKRSSMQFQKSDS